MEREHAWSLEALVAETRTIALHTTDATTALRQDVRRLDDRLFHMLLVQLATLATALGALVAALLS
jgi:hypothetical protein